MKPGDIVRGKGTWTKWALIQVDKDNVATIHQWRRDTYGQPYVHGELVSVHALEPVPRWNWPLWLFVISIILSVTSLIWRLYESVDRN